MSGRVGSVTTDIIADGLVFNMDPANRASYPKTGTTTTDTIGNQVGTLSSSPTFDPSEGEGVFDYDNTDYISYDSNSNLSGLTKATFSAWFNFGLLSTSAEPIFAGNRSNVANGFSMYNWTHNHSVSFFVMKTSTSNETNVTIRPSTFGDALAINTWYCMTAVFDGTIAGDDNSLKGYWNGIYRSNSNTLSNSNVTSLATNPDLIVGTYFNGYGHYFQGSIGPIHIYNRALSANEVLHNYNALKGRFE